MLLTKGRVSNQHLGEFRRRQHWIDGTRPGNAAFVSPPAEEVLECMGKLELFLCDQPEPSPVLLEAALAHVQFETIRFFCRGGQSHRDPSGGNGAATSRPVEPGLR